MEEDDYSDIINLPHHVSWNHPQMPMIKRAAQFRPFGGIPLPELKPLEMPCTDEPCFDEPYPAEDYGDRMPDDNDFCDNPYPSDF